MMTMIRSKKINVDDSIASKIFNLEVKEARGYIEDVTADENTVRPSMVKISDESAWQLYQGNDWILSTINRITRDCVKVKPIIRPRDLSKKITGRLEQRIKKVQSFLDNPNNNKESFSDIREKSIRDLLIYGRSTIEKVNNLSGSVIEIYAQDPKYIDVVSDDHGNIPENKAYRLRPINLSSRRHGSEQQANVWFDKNELIFMVLNPISKSHYGTKVLDGICNTVASDILRTTYNSNFFINGAEAAGILSLEDMSEGQLQKFRSYYKQNFKGVKNAHKTMAVNTKIDYVRMAITNRDLEFSEYGKELMLKIFAAYCVPAFIMGVSDGGEKDPNIQVELYKDGALKPILSKESYYYTREVIQDGFGYDDIELAFPGLDLVNPETQSNMDVAECASGIVTINEIRRGRGLPDVKWGDTPISAMPGGGQVDPNSGKLIPPSQQGGATGSKLPATSKPKPKPKNSKKEIINSIVFRYNLFKDEISKMTDDVILEKIVCKNEDFTDEENTKLVELVKKDNCEEVLGQLLSSEKTDSEINLNLTINSEKSESKKLIKINRDETGRPISLETSDEK